MADGTTLDTLSLELRGNATSAQESISGLITSLGSLSSRLSTALSALRSVNNELRQMQSLGVVGAKATGVNATQDSGAMSAYASTVGAVGNAVNIASENVGKLTVNIKEAGQASSSATRKTSGFANAMSRVGRIFSTMVIRLGLKKVISAFSDSWTAAYNFSKSIGGEFASSVDKASTLLSKATTSIVTAFSPALNALIPVITSVVSMIEYLCSAISWLFSLLGSASDFFGVSTDAVNKYADAAGSGGSANKELLASFDELNVISSASGGGGGGGASYVSGLTDSITGELDALTFYIGESLLAVGLILACTGHVGIGVALMAVGAAGIAKTIIEDWDKLSTEVKNQIAMITTIVGVSMLALGAILAFSGANIPLGIGMMAIGAINLAAAAYVSWKGGVSQEVMDQIAMITAYVGAASLAVGTILALSGAAVGIGIGLMVAGAASLATSVAISWSGGVSEEVKKKISEIAEIVGSALLVLGAILTFSGANIPLGLGMMAVGGLSLVAASSPDWDSFVSKLKSIFGTVKDYLVLVWDTVSTAATKAWNAVKQWWEDSGIGTAVRNVWAGIKTYFSQLWSNISSFATIAWNNVKRWWEESGIGDKVRTLWGGLSSYFRGLWQDISDLAGNAWIAVSTWWKNNVTDKVKKDGIWGGVKGFFEGLWNTIQENASRAWNEVKQWWESTGIGTEVRKVWTNVKAFLVDSVWEPVRKKLVEAWTKVEDWWKNSEFAQGIRSAWSAVANFLQDEVWTPIKTAITNAWDQVENWWNDSLVGKGIRAAWNLVSTFLIEEVWNPIKSVVTGAWDIVEDWWNTNIWDNITKAWNGIKGFFEDVFKPISDALNWLGEILGFNGKTVNMNVNINENTTKTTTYQPGTGSQITQTVEAQSRESTSTKKTNNSSGNWFSDVVSNGLKLLGFAEGGFPTSGDLFLANEEGAEYIGSMNGKTAVANQEEIISGIQRGVAEANSEQNSLLRQQNDLLRNILEKDSSVRLTASAALGRVTKQSMDLYSNVVGG